MTRRFLFLAAALAVAVAAPARDLLSLVPADAPFVVSIRDFPEVRKKWETTPLGRTWAEPSVQKFLAPLVAKLETEELQEGMGLKFEDVVGMARGPVVLAITRFDVPPPETGPEGETIEQEPDVGVAFLVHLGDAEADARKLLAAGAARGKSTTEESEFLGVKLHRVVVLEDEDEDEPAEEMEEGEEPEEEKPDEFWWAITGGDLFATEGRATMEAVIAAAVRGGPAESVANGEEMTNLRRRLGADEDLAIVVNIDPLARLLQERVAQMPPAEGNPMAPQPQELVAALRPDAFTGLYAGTLIGTTETRTVSALLIRENVGLATLVTAEGRPPELAWIPAEMPVATAMTFDLGGFFDRLVEIIGSVNAVYSGMIQGQLANFKQRQKIDIRGDFLGNLGSAIYSANSFRVGGASESRQDALQLEDLYIFSLKDTARFTDVVEKLKALQPGEGKLFEPTEFDGVTIHTATTALPAQEGQPERRISYAIAGGHLLLSVGTPEPIRMCLRKMKAGGRGFWDQPKVRAALREVPADATSYSYGDLSRVVPPVLRLVRQMVVDADEKRAAEKDDEDGESGERMVDPSVELNYAAIGRLWGGATTWTVRDGEGLFQIQDIEHPAP